MSQVQRRRTVRLSGDSEEFSESSYDDADFVKGSEGEIDLNANREGQRESVYEKAEPHEENGTDEEDQGTPGEDDDLSDSVIIEYEREDGDGQESVPSKEKKLDDDEDRRNPQYIPKRGTFYEHDDRTAEVDESAETPEKESERSKEIQADKKKVWKEHENKWDHDRYIEDEQSPKSREELIATYGYDIRNEEGPPRARRRRRYGRGPNKYTRNWEDVEAYGKPVLVPSRGGPRRGGHSGTRPDSEEEFPPLVSPPNTPDELQTVTYSNRVADRRGEPRNMKKEAFPPLQSDQNNHESGYRSEEMYSNMTSRDEKKLTKNMSINAWRKGVNNSQGLEEEIVPSATNWKNSNNARVSDISREKASLEENGGGSRRGGGNKPFNNRPLEDQEPSSEGSWRGKGQVKQASPAETQVFQSSPRGRGRGVRGGRSMTTAEFVPTSSRTLPVKSVSETRTTPPQIEGDMDNYPVKSQVIIPTQDNLSRDIGRMSLSEPAQTNNREYQNQRRPNKNNPNFYQNNERRQAVVPPRLQESAANRPKRYSSLRQRVVQETGIPQQTYPQPHSYYQTAFIAPPVYTEATQQLPAPTTPPLQLIPAPLSQPPPPPYAASFPSPPTFIQPAPPTFIATPAPGPPIINFVTPGPQGQFTAQLTPQPYPPFQGYAAVTPAQPPELYQPQGGITYYSPEEQIIPRPIAQKRQRAAIPIVPPPERSPRGRGRTQEEHIDLSMRQDGSGDAQLSLVSEQFEDATATQDIEVRHDEFNMSGDCGVPLPAVSTNIEQDTLA